MNSSNQSNGIGLTPKVQSLLKDQLEHEKLCVEKYTEYASKAKDPKLRQLFNEIGQCEQKHYDTVQTMLNGTIPNIQSQNSSSSSQSGMSGSTSTNTTSSTSGSTGSSSGQSSYSNSVMSSNSFLNTSMTGSNSTNTSMNSTNMSSSSNMSDSASKNSSSNTSYKNSSSGSSFENSSSDNYQHSKNYNYPPQSTLTSESKSYNEKQPATAQNPVMAADSIFSGYTGGGGLGSYVNQGDGSSLLRSYENTLEPEDLIPGAGISYGSYGPQDGGPTYRNSTNTSSTSYNTGSQSTNMTTGKTSSTSTSNTTNSKNTSMTNSTGSNPVGSTGPSDNFTDCDKKMCQDLLMTEKYVSRNYDTTIFECPNQQMRNVLNHIQKEEQQHGDKLYNYMHSKGWY